MFSQRSQPYLIRTTGAEVRLGTTRRRVPEGEYLCTHEDVGFVFLRARLGGPPLGWVDSRTVDIMFRTTTVAPVEKYRSFEERGFVEVPLPMNRGAPFGFAMTNEEVLNFANHIPEAPLCIILGNLRSTLAAHIAEMPPMSILLVGDSRERSLRASPKGVTHDFGPHQILEIDASRLGARHAVATELRKQRMEGDLLIFVSHNWGLFGIGTFVGFGAEEWQESEVTMVFEPPQYSRSEDKNEPHIRHARACAMAESGDWVRTDFNRGDLMWSLDRTKLQHSKVRLPQPPPPIEQDLSALWDEVQGASDVWVWNGNMGGSMLSPRAPWPLQRNRWASYESPFRGYVRGRLVGMTNQFAVVAVTHLCRRFGRDLIKTNEGIFLYGQDEPADYTLGEIGRHTTDYPPEIAYTRPLVRLFELGNVRAWGPWTRDPNAGEGMIGHCVVGTITPADEPVPCFPLSEYIHWTPRQAWERMPALHLVYADFDEFAQWQGLPDPHGVATAQGGFHADRLEVEPGLGNTVVLVYEGIEVRVIDAEAFNIAAPDPVEILDIRYIDRDRPVPTYMGRDGDWLLDGLGAFMDGSWVRDAHDALHGVWQAADRVSGLTASAGLADATNAAALGVAHAIAAGGLRDEDYHDAWSWLWTWPTTAYNFIVFQGAMGVAHVTGAFARGMPSQVRRPTQPLYEATLSAIGYNHNQSRAVETLFQVHDRWQQSILVQAQIAAVEIQMGDYRRALRLNDLAAGWLMDQWHGLVQRYGDREREDVNLYQL